MTVFGTAVDHLTEMAVRHTTHCLIGCGIGEVLGMAIGAALNWHNLSTTVLAIILAFFFSYLLTFRSVFYHLKNVRRAAKVSIGTDTASVTSMEITDNAVLWVWPGAMNAELLSWLFWLSLAIALAIAFFVTVPVNRFLLTRGIGPSEEEHAMMHH